MRLLVLSDIHNNIDHVRLVRAQEQNAFDAVIVGGDIGNDIAEEFFAIIDSFECPAFCVYGNWDYGLEYTRILSVNCRLVHHGIEQLGEYFLSGFSGCPTSWGRNPFYLEEQERINRRHRAIRKSLEMAQAVSEQKALAIETRHQDLIAKLAARTRDRRRLTYKKKVLELDHRKERALVRADGPLARLYRSKANKLFSEESGRLVKKALDRNRAKLFHMLRLAGLPGNKLILLTHERMYRIAEEGIRPLLHVFGHVHKYTFGKFKDTYYLNAAAIDNGLSAPFGRAEPCPEGYCTLTIVGPQVVVTRRLLNLGTTECAISVVSKLDGQPLRARGEF